MHAPLISVQKAISLDLPSKIRDVVVVANMLIKAEPRGVEVPGYITALQTNSNPCRLESSLECSYL